MNVVARLQGESDIKWAADGQDDKGFGIETLDCLEPEGEQTAYPWIFQDEQLTVAELAFKYRESVLVAFECGWRVVPVGIKRLPGNRLIPRLQISEFYHSG